MSCPKEYWSPEEIRKEFLRMLTTDSETKDRRRRGFNQAIFDAKEGWQVFNGTDLDMVICAFDKAITNLKRGETDG